MTRADSVHSTPPINTSALTPVAGLDWLDIKPDASSEAIFRAIGRRRKEARDDIDRLIRFLDESDDHMEREPDGDEEDVSCPHAGPRLTVGISEDDEDGAHDEPPLDSSGHYDGAQSPTSATPSATASRWSTTARATSTTAESRIARTKERSATMKG